MKTKLLTFAATFCVVALSTPAAILTFEEFSPPSGDFLNLFEPYQGVTLNFVALANDELVANSQHASDYWENDGTGPFLTPHSGTVALFNPGGAPIGLATDAILTGLWVARPNLGPTGVGGAERLSVTAYAGVVPLQTLSIDLTSTTPVFWDTRAFLGLTGVTRYEIAPAQPGKVTGYFVADDFQFASVSLAQLCPCAGPWRSHGEFIQYARAAVAALRLEGGITPEQERSVLRDAIQSDCGKKR